MTDLFIEDTPQRTKVAETGSVYLSADSNN